LYPQDFIFLADEVTINQLTPSCTITTKSLFSLWRNYQKQILDTNLHIHTAFLLDLS